MKGADPFIIAVILMAVTVTAAIAVSGWSSTLFSEQAAETRNQTDTKLSCQLASFFVRNVSVNCDNNCFTGSPYQMNATIKNTGSRDLEMSSVLVTLQDGTSYIIYGNMTSSLKGETLGKLYNSVQVSGSPKIPIQTMDLRSAYKNHTNTAGLWHFEDEGIKIADAALNNTGTMDADLNGTINGATWNTSGKYGNGLTFDGADDKVSIPHNSAINFTTNFSFTLWAKLEGQSKENDWPRVFSKGQSTTTNGAYGMWITDINRDDVACILTESGVRYFAEDGSAPSTDLEWHHYGCTYDGETLTLYIDGIISATTSLTITVDTNTNDLHIGDGNDERHFNGTVDEVTIWNRSLTGAEINSTMNSANPNNLSFENDMVGYWPFNEGSGSQANSEHFWAPGKFGNAIEFNGVDDYVEIQTTGFDNNTASLEAWIEMNSNGPADNYTILAVPSEISNGHTGLVGLWHFEESSTASNGVKDSSSSGNNGIVNGNPVYLDSGRFGGAWDFDSNGDYIDFGNTQSLSVTDAITVTAWVKRGSLGSRDIITGKGDGIGPSTSSYWLEFDSSNQIRFFLSKDGTSDIHMISTSSLVTDTDTWHFVVGTWDGQTQKIYLDSVVDNYIVSWSGSIGTNNKPFSIGRLGSLNSLLYDGVIDEVALYNRALSEDEIRDLYLGGLSLHKQNDNIRFVVGNITLVYNVSTWTGLHHVAGSYNSTTARLFADGTEVDSESNRALVVLGSDAYIGGLNRSFVFNGSIDEVRVSNYARDFNTTIAINVSHPNIKFVRLHNSTGQVNQSTDQNSASVYYTEYENQKTYNEFRVEVEDTSQNVIDKWYPYSEGGRCVSPSSVEKVFFSSLNCPSVADQVYGRDIHFESCV